MRERKEIWKEKKELKKRKQEAKENYEKINGKTQGKNEEVFRTTKKHYTQFYLQKFVKNSKKLFEPKGRKGKV